MDNIYNIILKKTKRANHIIFLNYLTGMKIVVPDNFDFQYSKNFQRIRFSGIGLKIGTDLHKHKHLKISLPDFQIFIRY